MMVKLWMNDKGASMMEYALLIVLVAIVAIVTLALLGEQIAALFERAGGELGGDPVTPTTEG